METQVRTPQLVFMQPQRLIVHLRGQQGIGMKRLGEWNTPHKVRRPIGDRSIRAPHLHTACARSDAGALEHISQAETGPRGIADGARSHNIKMRRRTSLPTVDLQDL